jgi:uncharacterized protein
MAKDNYQVAALPLKRGPDGRLLVMLVTSRETRRWVIPKGWPMRKLADHLAAAEEAWEEAGVRGTTSATALGTFTYDKQRRSGRPVALTVSVYILDVVDELDSWPEQGDRKRSWFSLADAAAAVSEPELQRLIGALIIEPALPQP